MSVTFRPCLACFLTTRRPWCATTRRAGAVDCALRDASTAEVAMAARDEHQEYVVSALACVDEAGEPVSRTVQ
jgi:hypothetical protein